MLKINKFAAQEIVDHYTSCLEKHRGNEALEVDWKNLEQVKTRNNTICNILSTTYQSEMDKGATVLDFGMGCASLFNSFGDWDDEQYRGCDASLEMVKEAGLRHYDDLFFHLPVGQELDKDESYEFIVVNGTFTEKGETSKYEWLYEVVKPTLEMLLKHTNICLIVNFMNSHSLSPAKQRDNLFFLDSNEMVNLAAELGIKKYTIKAGYLLYEHLVCLEK